MSGISFPNNLTVHIDPEAVSFRKQEDAQILAARATQAEWDKKSGLMSYSDFAKKFMFPEDTPRSRKYLEVYLSQFLGHLKIGTTRDPRILSEAEKNYRLLSEKIKDGTFFSSFHHFLSILKKDNDLGKKHTLVLRASKEDFKMIESMIQKSYPDIAFCQARFVEENERIKLEVLDPEETTSDLNKMQKIFDRSRYWLVEDLDQRPFPCSPKSGRVYCFLSGKEGEKNAIQVRPENAALKESYFSELVPKGEIIQHPVRARPSCKYTRTFLLALALAIASCLIPDSFFKGESL